LSNEWNTQTQREREREKERKREKEKKTERQRTNIYSKSLSHELSAFVHLPITVDWANDEMSDTEPVRHTHRYTYRWICRYRGT
jgi:hypothetical protein